MQLSCHNFVFRRLRPSERGCQVDHRIDLCHPDAYTGCCWHRGDVDQSPFTVADVDFYGGRPPLMTTACICLR